MGVVYRARHRTLDRQVAIKVMLPGAPADASSARPVAGQDPVAARRRRPRLRGPARRLPDAGHGMDRGRQPPQAADGAPAGRCPRPRCWPWMRQVCEGMQTRRRTGDHPPRPQARPTSCSTPTAAPASPTSAWPAGRPRRPDLHGQRSMGTPYYMAPEQAEDPRGVDTRADVYSFGATFYHVLTGVTAVRGRQRLLHPVQAQDRAADPAARPQPAACPSTSASARALPGQVAQRPLPVVRARCCGSWSRRRAAVAWDAGDERPWPPTWPATRHAAAVYLHRRERADRAGRLRVPRRPACSVPGGNLAEQQADALVSSDDGHLTMGATVPDPRGGGVAAAGSGAGVRQREARRFVPVRPGRVVVTSAGPAAGPLRLPRHHAGSARSSSRVCPAAT